MQLYRNGKQSPFEAVVRDEIVQSGEAREKLLHLNRSGLMAQAPMIGTGTELAEHKEKRKRMGNRV